MGELAALRMPQFELSLAGIGGFGKGRQLRSLWAGVDSQPALTRLQAKVEQAVTRAGQPPQARRRATNCSRSWPNARCTAAGPLT